MYSEYTKLSLSTILLWIVMTNVGIFPKFSIYLNYRLNFHFAHSFFIQMDFNRMFCFRFFFTLFCSFLFWFSFILNLFICYIGGCVKKLKKKNKLFGPFCLRLSRISCTFKRSIRWLVWSIALASKFPTQPISLLECFVAPFR